MHFAHTTRNPDKSDWQPLAEHLQAVGEIAAGFGAAFGWEKVAELAGRLHDAGKCSAEFQAYIRGERATGGDHSTAGAQIAARTYGKLGRMLAFIIAGHHAGLADADGLERRLQIEVPRHDGWAEHTGPLPPIASLLSPAPCPGATKGFEAAFLIRMLFSCLVDADSLDTGRFDATARGESIAAPDYTPLEALRDRLRAFMKKKRAGDRSINVLRAEVLDHVVRRAALPPGLFTLTVPTGGGKTLASLSFALEHGVQHELRRIIYVIPFTSIIEQTAQVFREALRTERDILEHHASFDWESAAGDFRHIDDEGADALRILRRAAENWDAPVVVTTAVQFFESLFANKRSRCRKLHNLVGSVIVLDEAQTLPVPVLLPCLAALDELARNYRCSVVLCTATQPAVRRQDGAIVDKRKNALGLDISDERELAPDPRGLFTRLKRFEIERLPGTIEDDVIAARFSEQPQMLCIVNSRKHACVVFDRIRQLPGAVHLSTLMCPRHRRTVLAKLREKIAAGEPVRLVSTSLIEAGVDISFPEVWRALAGFSSILQAGGRCNREGAPILGRLVVFEPAEQGIPRDLKPFRQAAETVLRQHADDLQTIDAIKDYFAELYWTKGVDALDAAKIGNYCGILPAISERSSSLSFPFRSIAEAFRIIEDVMEPIVAPWGAGPEDRDADGLLARIAVSESPRRDDLRGLQQYIVGIPRKQRAAWLAAGILKPVHPGLGDAVLMLDGLALYDPETGVRVDGRLGDYII